VHVAAVIGAEPLRMLDNRCPQPDRVDGPVQVGQRVRAGVEHAEQVGAVGLFGERGQRALQ